MKVCSRTEAGEIGISCRKIVFIMAVVAAVACVYCVLDTSDDSSAESSGITGSCEWTLYDDGILVISGYGPMGEYSEGSPAPWGTSVRSIVFEHNVTSIGSWAFYECIDLASIDIPSSVTRIGDYAFYCCFGLSAIDFSTSYSMYLGAYAFGCCPFVTHVSFPLWVSMDPDAFYGFVFYDSDGLTRLYPWFLSNKTFEGGSSSELVNVGSAWSGYDDSGSHTDSTVVLLAILVAAIIITATVGAVGYRSRKY